MFNYVSITDETRGMWLPQYVYIEILIDVCVLGKKNPAELQDFLYT